MADGKRLDADIVGPGNISIEQSIPTAALSKSSTLTKVPMLPNMGAGKVKYMLLIGRVAARNAKGRAVRGIMFTHSLSSSGSNQAR